jgi:hypothetical protein
MLQVTNVVAGDSLTVDVRPDRHGRGSSRNAALTNAFR